MTTITFDTLSAARRLREKGASQELAEAIADEMRLNASVDISHLSTKEEVQTFKSELKEDLQKFATKHDIEIIKRDLTISMGTMIAVAVGLIAALIKFG